MGKVTDLNHLVDRLDRLTNDTQFGEIAKAKGLVQEWVNRARQVRISAGGSYGQGARAEEVAVAESLKSELVEKYRLIGEAARDARLLEIQAEIETIRFKLAEANRAAFIEAGQIGKSLTPPTN